MPGRLTLISAAEGSAHITSQLFGDVWIFRRPGDIITSEDITVAVLEAMQTEIPIKAGVGNIQ
jgi:biotin carboxyl carrier protein